MLITGACLWGPGVTLGNMGKGKVLGDLLGLTATSPKGLINCDSFGFLAGLLE